MKNASISMYKKRFFRAGDVVRIIMHSNKEIVDKDFIIYSVNKKHTMICIEYDDILYSIESKHVKLMGSHYE